MLKKVAKNFALFHFIHIIIFSIIYYYLMMDMETHFVINSQIPNTVYDNKILNSLFYTCAIESTNGLADITPSSTLSRSITTIQYVSTILISIGIFTYL